MNRGLLVYSFFTFKKNMNFTYSILQVLLLQVTVIDTKLALGFLTYYTYETKSVTLQHALYIVLVPKCAKRKWPPAW